MAPPRRVPPLIAVADIARAIGLPTDRTRALLLRAGVLERLGRHYYARRSALRERLGDVYEDVFAFYELPEAAA